MNTLHIIYDSECDFCVQCRRWLEGQRKFLELKFVPRNSPLGQTLIQQTPQVQSKRDELVVISDEGGIYQGAKGFLMCLYALEDYREFSMILSSSGRMILVRRAFELLSRRRYSISSLMRWWENQVEQIHENEALKL